MLLLALRLPRIFRWLSWLVLRLLFEFVGGFTHRLADLALALPSVLLGALALLGFAFAELLLGGWRTFLRGRGLFGFGLTGPVLACLLRWRRFAAVRPLALG